jgi:hypothetical protein
MIEKCADWDNYDCTFDRVTCEPDEDEEKCHKCLCSQCRRSKCGIIFEEE